MRVTVRFYGIIGDIAKRKDQEIELQDGASVADLLSTLSAENPDFGPIAKQVRAVANGQNVARGDILKAGDDVVLMRAIGGGAMTGGLLRHADLPIIPSPSGLPSQHIVTEAIGSTSLFLGQQWLQPGDEVFRHSHPCEEALMFLSGSGEASIDDGVITISPGSSIFFPARSVHGFRNTGETEMHVIIVFPVPYFAETTMVDRAAT